MARLTEPIRRELRLWNSSLGTQMLLFWLPVIACVLLLAIFSQRVIHGLPIAVVDLDQSALSRELVAKIDAAPAVRVTRYENSMSAARSAMNRGDIYAVVEFPRYFYRDIVRGQQPDIGLLLNEQALAAAGAINRPVTTVVLTAAGEVSVGLRAAAGVPLPVAIAMAQPVRVEAHPLFNPGLDYAAYLGIALIAATVHCFAFLHGARTITSERGNWLRENRWAGLGGKLLAVICWWWIAGSLLLFASFVALDLPSVSEPLWLIIGWGALVIAYVSLGCGFALLFPSHIAYSCVSVLAGPAVAFSGVTFPQGAMPLLPRLYGESLPLTSFLHLQTKLVTERVELGYAIPELLQLVLMALLCACLAIGAFVWFLARHRDSAE